MDVQWLALRYSTYSTYSKDLAESGCSAGCRALHRSLAAPACVDASVRAACCMVFACLHGFCMVFADMWNLFFV